MKKPGMVGRFVSLTYSEGGAYHFDVAAFSTPAASLSSVTAQRLTSLH
jgi:hypothetical protein